MKIIFMGSQEFSLNFLKFFIENEWEIIAVFTREPKASGRGKKVLKTPVHEYAVGQNLPVYTPKTLKNFDFSIFKDIDLNFVVGYGLILPKNVIEFPKFGTMNVHPSDLPRYRGAAPIERTLMNGEIKTKSIIMFMDEGLDTGDILDEKEIEILKNDNFSSLSKKIIESAKMQILKIFENPMKFLEMRKKQDESGATYAHKITSNDKIINFNKEIDSRSFDEFNVFNIFNKIRALNEMGGVSFLLKNLNFEIKIFEAEYEIEECNIENIQKGSFDYPEKHEIEKIGLGILEGKVFKIICLGGKIIPKQIRKQNGNGKILSNKDFANGLNF